jgi:transposase
MNHRAESGAKQEALASVPCVTGLDLGDKWRRYCALDSVGGIIEEVRVRSTAEAVRERFGHWNTIRIVIETETHSRSVSRVLEGVGHSVVVANARKLWMIYASDRKNDRLDARMLARLGRADVDLLAPIWHRSAQVQVDLAVIWGRDALVAARTQLINCYRGAVKAIGGRLPKSTSPLSSPQEVSDPFSEGTSVVSLRRG